jgi:hypothetical protein
VAYRPGRQKPRLEAMSDKDTQQNFAFELGEKFCSGEFIKSNRLDVLPQFKTFYGVHKEGA